MASASSMGAPASTPPTLPDAMNGDELRNINSFEYLQLLSDAVDALQENISTMTKEDRYLTELRTTLSQITEKCAKESIYNKQFAYGNLYTDFLKHLEAAIPELQKQSNNNTTLQDTLDTLIILIYLNPNTSLERSFALISSAVTSSDASISTVQKGIEQKLQASTPINNITPSQAGSVFARAQATLSRTYKPMRLTSMPTIRKYRYFMGRETAPIEIRMGTQAQRHKNKARVSPLFVSFLTTIFRKYPSNTYLYFNNLGFDRDDLEGKLERDLTTVLHQLEQSFDNLYVVTLPADKGLLHASDTKKYGEAIKLDKATNRIVAIATGGANERDEPIQDFFWSKKTQIKLFGAGPTGAVNTNNKSQTIKRLVNESFQEMGFSTERINVDTLSPSDFIAVYFYFIKYKLTHYLITTLNPCYINFSCKDGIDRGGAASALYHFMASVNSNESMSEEEFNRAIHAAPAMVKGRAMNDHFMLIWNTLYVWMQTRYELPECLQWLPRWLSQYAPEGSVQYYINLLAAEQVRLGQDMFADQSQRLFSTTQSASTSSDSNNETKKQIVDKWLNHLRNGIDCPLTDTEKRALMNDKSLSALFTAISEAGLFQRSTTARRLQAAYERYQGITVPKTPENSCPMYSTIV